MSLFWKKVAAVAFLLFLILWVVGLSGGFALPLPRASAEPVAFASASRREDGQARQQLANNLRELGLAREPVRGVLDRADLDKIQVHEKIGRVATTTTDFAADEAAIRTVLEGQKVVMVNETSGGVAPNRRAIEFCCPPVFPPVWCA